MNPLLRQHLLGLADRLLRSNPVVPENRPGPEDQSHLLNPEDPEHRSLPSSPEVPENQLLPLRLYRL